MDVQFCKYSPSSRCRPSSCILALLAVFSSVPNCSSRNEWNIPPFRTVLANQFNLETSSKFDQRQRVIRDHPRDVSPLKAEKYFEWYRYIAREISPNVLSGDRRGETDAFVGCWVPQPSLSTLILRTLENESLVYGKRQTWMCTTWPNLPLTWPLRVDKMLMQWNLAFGTPLTRSRDTSN